MNSSLDPKREAQSSKSPRRLIGGSVFAWFAGQIRSAFRILSAAWTGRTPNDEGNDSAEGFTTPLQTPRLGRENATLDPDSTDDGHAEKEPVGTPHLMPPADEASKQKNSLPASELDAGFNISNQPFASDPAKPWTSNPPPVAFATSPQDAGARGQVHPSELLTAVRTLHETPSELDRNTVTRDKN